MPTMELKLRSFKTPNFVLTEMPPRPRQEGFDQGPKFALKEVDADKLVDLCDQFRAEIFEKAEKPDPGRNNRDLVEALDRLLLAVENDQLLPASCAPVKDARAALAKHI